jgi:hypothetical protein
LLLAEYLRNAEIENIFVSMIRQCIDPRTR